MRLERIWAQQAKDKQVADALAVFAAMQTGLNSEKAEKKVGPSKTEGKTEGKTSVAGLNSKKVVVGRKMSGTGVNSEKVDKKVSRKMSGNKRKASEVRKSQPINC